MNWSIKINRFVKYLIAGIIVLSAIPVGQIAMMWHFSGSGQIGPSADLIAVFPGDATRVVKGVALATKGVS